MNENMKHSQPDLEPWGGGTIAEGERIELPTSVLETEALPLS